MSQKTQDCLRWHDMLFTPQVLSGVTQPTCVCHWALCLSSVPASIRHPGSLTRVASIRWGNFVYYTWLLDILIHCEIYISMILKVLCWNVYFFCCCFRNVAWTHTWVLYLSVEVTYELFIWQVEYDSGRLSRLPLQSLSSASPVVLVRRDDSKRKILHSCISLASFSYCMWRLYQVYK